MIRVAQKDDVSHLASLWKRCFREEDDFADRFLAACIECGQVLVEGRLAMACLVPLFGQDGEVKMHYLYALCTAKTLRKKGIATALLEEAKRRSVALCLYPASESLRLFYEKRGFIYPATLAVWGKEGKSEGEKATFPLRAPEAFDALIRESLFAAQLPKEGGERRRICDSLGEYTVLMAKSALCTVDLYETLGTLPI